VARRLGFLPQDAEASPQGSLQEAVLLGRFAHLGFWRPPESEDMTRATRALEEVGLSGMAGRDLGSLSGGEQRRAAVARLLVQAPAVYLLDEPTNHLDPAQQIGVLTVMQRLAAQGAAVMASLHDPNLAIRFAHRVLLLTGNGHAELVDTALLATAHLERLYGLGYQETRAGGQRFMMPA
jgi:iron complex transport system ATP-binding protein